MVDYFSALSFAGIVLISTLKPGPGFVAVLSRALSDGWQQGVAMALGNATIHVVYFVLVCLTFTFASGWVEFLTFLLKALGAVFMIWLGIKEFMKLDASFAVASGGSHVHALLQNYAAGAAVCAANPLVVFLYAALVPTFVHVEALDVTEILVFSFLVLAMNGGGLAVISMVADNVRVFFLDKRNLRAIRIMVGVVFIIIGLAIGLSALPFIDWTKLYFGETTVS